jgi:hypothetical protein
VFGLGHGNAAQQGGVCVDFQRRATGNAEVVDGDHEVGDVLPVPAK